MQCTEVHSLFTDFMDNTLTREELHALTDHLLGCQACALEWREFQQTISLVHSLELQAPPVDLLSGIQAKLAKKGIFDRIWTLAESFNFSLSIPAAAAIFTFAMLAGFLLRPSLPEQPRLFQSRSARISPLPQGEVFTSRRPPVPSNSIFAVSHNGARSSWDLGQHDRPALTSHLSQENDPHRLLSPDMHILIQDIDHNGQALLCQEMSHRNWQLHRLGADLFLIHLPQADLEVFHELLAQHRFAIIPAAAAETHFGSNKKVLTAVVRFQ